MHLYQVCWWYESCGIADNSPDAVSGGLKKLRETLTRHLYEQLLYLKGLLGVHSAALLFSTGFYFNFALYNSGYSKTWMSNVLFNSLSLSISPFYPTLSLYDLNFFERFCLAALLWHRTKDGGELPLSLHWWTRNGQEWQTADLQGFEVSSCHPELHASGEFLIIFGVFACKRVWLALGCWYGLWRSIAPDYDMHSVWLLRSKMSRWWFLVFEWLFGGI